MRILYIIDTLGPGGKERQLVEILKNLPKEYQTGVITFNQNMHYAEEVKKLCMYYKELAKRPTRFEPLFSIWPCIKKFNPDIIHTWDSLSSFYCCLPANFFSIPYADGSIRDAGVDLGIHYLFKRFFLKRASVIIANSNAGLNFYKVNGKVVYNLIDLKRFHKCLPKEKPNLINVSNFTSFKDHETFFEACEKLIGQELIDQVYLIGTGTLEEKYKNLVMKKDPEIAKRYHFIGKTFETEKYLSQCQIGVLCSTPSFSEGISNSVLEYMASGLVPIATRTGAIPEIIEHEKNGFLHEPKNSQSIVEAVRNVNNNLVLKQQILENAQKTIAKKFDAAKNLAQLIQIYENTCKNKKPVK